MPFLLVQHCIFSGALKSVIQGHGAFKVLAVVPSRQGHSISKQERIETWDYVNSVYFGPERDMKNFPNPTQPAKHEPVRLGIVPQSWFDFMYPKTGVTGLYTFSDSRKPKPWFFFLYFFSSL